MNKIELVNRVTIKLDVSGMFAADEIAQLIEDNGIIKGMHEDQDEKFFENRDRVSEWILGQYLGIIKTNSTNRLNALINYSYSWMEDKS